MTASMLGAVEPGAKWIPSIEAVKPPAPAGTVAIPTHNRANLLREAVDSVLQQTFQDFVLLVLDDASTDETPMVVDSYTNIPEFGTSGTR